MSRRTTLYIAMSEDGFIAGPDDDLSFLNTIQAEGEDFGYAEFLEGIDTVIVGRKTHDVVTGMGHSYHPDKEVFIITRSGVPAEGDGPWVHRWSGSLAELVAKLRASEGRGIYCDGGAEVARQMIDQGLIDEMVLTVFPTTLYAGVELFAGGQVPEGFEEVTVKPFMSGLVQYRYLRMGG